MIELVLMMALAADPQPCQGPQCAVVTKTVTRTKVCDSQPCRCCESCQCGAAHKVAVESKRCCGGGAGKYKDKCKGRKVKTKHKRCRC